MNSEDPAAHCLLNPANRLCAQVKRMFAVHLRIHRNNVRLWLNEKAFQREKMGSMGFGGYLSFFYRRIFLSGKTSEDGMLSPFSNTFVYPSLCDYIQHYQLFNYSFIIFR